MLDYLLSEINKQTKKKTTAINYSKQLLFCYFFQIGKSLNKVYYIECSTHV